MFENEVWALVSGLPTGERERRLIMSLQAYFDDSGSEPQSSVFLLAGYIAKADGWREFTDRWQACLDEAPGAAYFKSAEAFNLRDEFSLAKGWTRALRDARVIALSKIIADHCLFSVSAAIRHQDFADTVKALPMFSGERTKANDHPYTYLWFHLISELWMHSPMLGVPGPCDFIFDEQLGFQEEAHRYWAILKEAMSRPPAPPWLDWVGSDPIFRDDKTFRPLQAADLCAWSNRRAMTFAPDNMKLPAEAMERLVKVPARHMDFTRDVLITDTLRAAALLTKAPRSKD